MNGNGYITDLVTLSTAVDGVYGQFAHQPWWRGQGNETWSLDAGVYRVTGRGASYESHIAVKFSQRAPTRHSAVPPAGALASWLFLAQHYRLRTRLLDWTESPLIALYFAVTDPKTSGANAALWALDPFALNDEQVQMAGLLQPGHQAVKKLIEAAFSVRAQPEDTILALLTEEVDPRMMVQLSGMTVHGSHQPIDVRRGAAQYLRKFIVPAAARDALRVRLERLGVRERNVFPDLDHLSADLNRDSYSQ